MSFSQILNVSISASWLVGVIVLIRFVMKGAPRSLICVLWAMVAIRLLCPVLPESGLSLVPTAQVVPERYLAMEPGENYGTQAVLDLVTNPIYPGNVDVHLDMDVERLQWKDLYWTINWWVGMGVMAVYALYSYLRLRLRTRIAMKLRDNIWLCDDIDSPFILGVFRPKICLPSGMALEQRNHVIAHEQAHLKRFDHWWKPLGFGLLTVHWFNPVMWLAYCLLCRDIELACDERVIRDLDKRSVRAYSEALIACGTKQRLVTACPLAFGEVGVKERVKSMIRYKKPGFWIMLIAVVLSLIAAVCFLTNPPATTIGNLKAHGFDGLLKNVEELYLCHGEYILWQNDSDGKLEALVERIGGVALKPNPVSYSLDEGRDRTYEIHIGSSILCISDDFSFVWVDDGVKPSYGYTVEAPEELRQLLGEYIPSIPGISAGWLDTELDRIVYQDGYQITQQQEVSIPVRLYLDELPEAVFSMGLEDEFEFAENEIIVYQDDTSTWYLSYIDVDRSDGMHYRLNFKCSYRLADQGSVILPYRVNIGDGQSVSFRFGTDVKENAVNDATQCYQDAVSGWGNGPGEAFGVYIRRDVLQSAADYLEFTAIGFNCLSYTNS